MQQTDHLFQTKQPLTHVAVSFAAILTACTSKPTFFDESQLKEDSIIVKNDAGETLSRTIYYYDSEGRDTMMTVDNIQYGPITRTTKFNSASLVISENFDGQGGSAYTEYKCDSLGHATEAEEYVTSKLTGATSHWHKDLTTDAKGNITQSIRHDSIGNLTKITIVRDSLGNETENVTYKKGNGADTWTPDRRYTYSYSHTSDTSAVKVAATFFTWEEKGWEEQSSEKYTYDAAGRKTEKVETADEIRVISRTTYDEAGNEILTETTTYDTSEGDKPTDIKKTETKYTGNIKIRREYRVMPNGENDPQSTTTITYYSPKHTNAARQ